MKIIQEFKEFAVKGNVIDMAVGIIIGAAFTGIVNSLVNDIIMPPIGLLIKGIDFSNLSVIIKSAADKVPAVEIKYGRFINYTISFLITAWTVFMMVKAINFMKRKKDETPVIPPMSREAELLTEIKNILQEKNNDK
jgi:large conductance mechanosensitive channel